MFLGLWNLEDTLTVCIQLAVVGVPVTADATPTFRIYSADSNVAVATGNLSATVIDSQTGWHSLSKALTSANMFAVGVYAIRVQYVVSAVTYVQEYAFEIV